ncbi:hypothetical protein VP1G_03224 [Cytospora mali]|uniref:Uncharacterized protein n=1 Tax=Cytospora mali TaxID=578113 RepID=A0A194UVZ4_CYTMA|nr:hypothetical protein VP1G_03224 [Valsa mali var. pyri (nom. inval.)]
MDSVASDQGFKHDPDHHPSLPTSASPMELSPSSVNQEDDAEMEEVPAAFHEVEELGVLISQSQQTATTNNHPAAPVYEASFQNTEFDSYGDSGGSSDISSHIEDDDDSDYDSRVEGESVNNEGDEAVQAINPDGPTEAAYDLWDQILSESRPDHRATYKDLNDDERSIFVDLDDDPDVIAAEIASISDDSESEIDDSEDSKDDEDGETGADVSDVLQPTIPRRYIPRHHVRRGRPYRRSSSIEPTQLERLLYSHSRPSRRPYEFGRELEQEDHRVVELKKLIRSLRAELRDVRSHQTELRADIAKARSGFCRACAAAGISDELWQEYEAFCESLEPKFGSRGGWSVTCYEDHEGSYVKYDRHLNLFVQSAEMPLGACNLRCEASVIESYHKREYVVEFWPLASPEPLTEGETTWGQQYPNLYRLARIAAYEPTHTDGEAARELLRLLPDQQSPCSGGWLFEYRAEPARANHPVKSRQWSYRSAHNISNLAEKRRAEDLEDDDVEDDDVAGWDTDLAVDFQAGLMMMDSE